MTAPQGAPANATTLLVVEDTQHIRKIICHHLLGAGFAVVEATDGAEALQLLKLNRVAVVLCDVMMPNLDGVGFLKAVRTDPAFASLPVIICSAKGQQADVLQMMSLGATDYIVKPFTKDTLLAKVRKALGAEAAPRPPDPGAARAAP